MNNFGVIELASTRTTNAPGWAYVPDISAAAAAAAASSAAAVAGGGGPRKRAARNLPAAAVSGADLSARLEAKVRKEIEVLDRDNSKDVVIPVPGKGFKALQSSKHTPNVRKILQSAKTFANHLDDFAHTVEHNPQGAFFPLPLPLSGAAAASHSRNSRGGGGGGNAGGSSGGSSSKTAGDSSKSGSKTAAKTTAGPISSAAARKRRAVTAAAASAVVRGKAARERRERAEEEKRRVEEEKQKEKERDKGGEGGGAGDGDVTMTDAAPVDSTSAGADAALREGEAARQGNVNPDNPDSTLDLKPALEAGPEEVEPDIPPQLKLPLLAPLPLHLFPTPHPTDADPLLMSRIPPPPTAEEIRALVEARPLTYGEARARWPDRAEGGLSDRAVAASRRRKFCAVCGYWGKVRCGRCAGFVCALDCLEVHRQECVSRYGV